MKNIIRKDIHGNNINFGDLKEITIDGIKCYMDGFFAKAIGFKTKDVEVGEFLTDISINVTQDDVIWDRVIFVKNKDDLKKVTIAVSKLTSNGKPLKSSIYAMARTLYRCEKGEVISENKLENFYDYLTDAEKAYYSF